VWIQPRRLPSVTSHLELGTEQGAWRDAGGCSPSWIPVAAVEDVVSLYPPVAVEHSSDQKLRFHAEVERAASTLREPRGERAVFQLRQQHNQYWTAVHHSCRWRAQAWRHEGLRAVLAAWNGEAAALGVASARCCCHRREVWRAWGGWGPGLLACVIFRRLASWWSIILTSLYYI